MVQVPGDGCRRSCSGSCPCLLKSRVRAPRSSRRRQTPSMRPSGERAADLSWGNNRVRCQLSAAPRPAACALHTCPQLVAWPARSPGLQPCAPGYVPACLLVLVRACPCREETLRMLGLEPSEGLDVSDTPKGKAHKDLAPLVDLAASPRLAAAARVGFAQWVVRCGARAWSVCLPCAPPALPRGAGARAG